MLVSQTGITVAVRGVLPVQRRPMSRWAIGSGEYLFEVAE